MNGARAGGSLLRTLAVPAALVALAALASPRAADAGAYIFAGEANGVDLILHPQGYTGSQNLLTVEVCIDPSSPAPTGFTLTDLEIPVQNNIAIWNQLQPIVGNSLLGSANNLGATEIDFESVALHELGHCIGLAHPNAASESGLSGADRDYTKATDGINNFFNLNAGTDGVRGSSDDLRGDDVNLHWFRTDSNDPGELPLPAPVDATTYDRNQTSLPGGHTFAANLDRTVAGLLGHPSTATVNTEAVMQQGSFSDEDQRRLTADGVGTLLLAMSGADETADTSDDYVIDLIYGGISSAASCDVTMDFAPSSLVGLAFCSVGGAFISSPPGTTHARITTAQMRFGLEFNWFFNAEGPCRQSHDLTTGQWKQIAISCDPGASNTVADVFGDDLTGTYDVNWVVYERDTVSDVYVKLGLGDTLEPGRGYWIKTNQASQSVDVDGQFNGQADFALTGAANGRFNMAGHRYWYEEDWAEARVIDGASVLTLDQADPVVGSMRACSMVPPDSSCVMSRVAYRWNGAAYDSFDGETPGAEGSLVNFDGLWVKAFKSGIALRMPDLRSTAGAPHGESGPRPLEPVSAAPAAAETWTASAWGPRPPEPRVEEWHVRLVVESGDLSDGGNLLGRLGHASDGLDRHDHPELTPFGSDYLTVVFPHPDWGDHAGDYTTDFHGTGGWERWEKWRFDVLSGTPGREVTLRWEGPRPQLRRSVLVDLERRRSVRPGRDGSYTFTPDGERHSFVWMTRGLGPRYGAAERDPGPRDRGR